MKNGEFRIRQFTANEHGVRYRSFQVVGYLPGERVRKRFKSRAEALAEMNRLQVAAANTEGALWAVNSRLTGEQVAEAEFAIRQFGGKSRSAAVDWYLTTYRPPLVEQSFADAVTAFLAEQEKSVRIPM